MWEAAKVFLAKHGQARSSPASLQGWTCGLQRNGMRFAPRIDMVNKHEIESIDNGYIYIYMDISCANSIRPDIPNLHKPTTLVVHPKQKCENKYQNKGIKATKTGRTVLDTSCCILKLKRPLNFPKHHDLAIWMDTYQVIRRTNRLKVKVVTKFNTKTCQVFQVWSDHLGLFGA